MALPQGWVDIPGVTFREIGRRGSGQYAAVGKVPAGWTAPDNVPAAQFRALMSSGGGGRFGGGSQFSDRADYQRALNFGYETGYLTRPKSSPWSSFGSNLREIGKAAAIGWGVGGAIGLTGGAASGALGGSAAAAAEAAAAAPSFAGGAAAAGATAGAATGSSSALLAAGGGVTAAGVTRGASRATSAARPATTGLTTTEKITAGMAASQLVGAMMTPDIPSPEPLGPIEATERTALDFETRQQQIQRAAVAAGAQRSENEADLLAMRSRRVKQRGPARQALIGY